MDAKIDLIIQKGLGRHKDHVDKIVSAKNQSADDKHEVLLTLFYGLINNGSYTDWCFA